MNILKSEDDDATVFKGILAEIMDAYNFIDKSSFWLVKNDGEHYLTGIGYEDEPYSNIVIPLEESLSAIDPEEDVKIVNSGNFPENFPEKIKETFLEAGIKENISKTLQIRLKPFGDYFGVLCFDILDDSANFDDRVLEEFKDTATAINILLEMRITLNHKKSENIYRDHLVASISHDVRTPLTVIMGYIELMQSLIQENEKESDLRDNNHRKSNLQINEFLNIMEEQANYLLNIISDLITLSKINSGNYQISPQKTNIRELINNTIKGLKILAKKKRLKVNTRLSATVPTFTFIDRTALKKILNNLISNAIKYTDKGYVSLECKIEGKDYLKFIISDTGPGIAKEKLSYIFEKYSREQNTSNKPGSGLGLSISKELTEELNGSIWAQSTPGKGSQFHLLLPLNSSEQGNVENKKKGHNPTNLAGKKILLIEDEVENLHMYELVLRNAGVQCLTFTNPQEALQKCRIAVNVDYVLIDLLLSMGSSLHVISVIKNRFPQKKIIAFTASSDPELQSRALEAGASIVLLKPFSLKELYESIDD